MNPLPRPIIQGAKWILSSRLLEPVARPLAGLGTCLMYHRVIDEPQPRGSFHPNASLIVSCESFEAQMRFISENYQCLDVHQALQRLKQQDLMPGTVIVTFDDGYRDNLEFALPILERYKIPAAIFVTVGLLEKFFQPWWHELEDFLSGLQKLELTWNNSNYSWRLETPAEKRRAFQHLNSWLMVSSPKEQEALLEALRSRSAKQTRNFDLFLDWDQVQLLDRHPLITIGSHSMRHSVLSQLSSEELRDELVDSRQVLEKRLSHPIDFFCYPYGSSVQAGEREFAAVKAAGYSAAFTTRCGHLSAKTNGQLMALPRMDVGYYDTMLNFKWKLSGWEALRRERTERPSAPVL